MFIYWNELSDILWTFWNILIYTNKMNIPFIKKTTQHWLMSWNFKTLHNSQRPYRGTSDDGVPNNSRFLWLGKHALLNISLPLKKRNYVNIACLVYIIKGLLIDLDCLSLPISNILRFMVKKRMLFCYLRWLF